MMIVNHYRSACHFIYLFIFFWKMQMNIINEGPVANDVTMIMVTKVIED